MVLFSQKSFYNTIKMEKENERKKKTRLRGENWTQEEKDLFLEIMLQSVPIIENKLTDTNTNKRKHLEWVKIQNKLKELTGKPRAIAQLKGFWNRGKVAAKKAVSQHRRALRATGGGERLPSPLPDEDEDHDMDREKCEIDTFAEDHDIDREKCEIATFAEVLLHSNDDKEPKASNAPNWKRNIKPNTSEAAIVEANIGFKNQASQLMEAEYKLKIEYHNQELVHQKMRHKLEIELLNLDKELKLAQLQILKKKD